MARTTIIANLGKMLKVQTGISEGLSVSKACKAAKTSSGTYKKWRERYAALGTPLMVTPLSRNGQHRLSGDGRTLFVLDFEPSGMLLTRFNLATGAQLTHRTDEPADRYAYRSIVAAGVSHSGDRVLFLRNSGEVLSWHPEAGSLEEISLNLKNNACDLDSQTMSGVRRWTTVAFSSDLKTVAYWHSTSTDSQAVLKIVDITSGEERLSKVVAGRHLRPQLVFHPTQPLLSFLAENNLITILNHQTGEVLVEGGPQAHSVSFSTGDTLLFDDWYGKTMVLNHATGEKKHQSPGWGSHGSQSTRFITARQSELHVRDTADTSIDRILNVDEIVECGLSLDGRILAIRTDCLATNHQLGIWDVPTLLEDHEGQ
jgi:hypothetical protein